jgi:hypothetical protein
VKLIEQPEINYIFRTETHDLYNAVAIKTEDKIVKLLTKHPAAALAAAWNVAFGRSGLSPFTIHYLLKSPLSVEEWTEKHIKKSGVVDYSYCHSTRLPVVNNLMRQSWNPPYQIIYRRLPRYDYYDQAYYARLRRIRDDRFDVLSAQLVSDKAAGLVDDEYMRNFGGHPIAKDKWLHLKGVAGIYL